MARKSSADDPFSHYLSELQRNVSSGIAAEQTHRHALQDLLESLDPKILAFNDPKHIRVGAPDFTIRRKGNAMAFPVGWAETKDIGENLDDAEGSDQLERYLGLPNLILTDYLEFRWYTDGKKRLTARLADKRGRKIAPQPTGGQSVGELLSAFLTHQVPAVASARELALRMAKLAHLIRDLILRTFEVEPEHGKLHKQFQAFLETLIPDLKPPEFADMYAQTIAYGLFAARCEPSRAGEKFTRESAAYLIPRTNPFLRKLFNEIAGPELSEGIRPFVDDLVALLRGADFGSILTDLGRRTAKEDPVVHFYEDFLQEYDPRMRELRGVYYTPEPVVSFIVRSVDHILKTEFKKPLGLADKDVLILDPACGTGTFLYYVVRHVYQTLLEQGQKGQWNSYVSENLLKRVFGFELLMAPYAVAHLKLGLLLQELGYQFDADERLGIYLTNTLEEAAKRAQQVFAFADAITDEGIAAQRIKRDDKIMVVLGNPPYSGHSANRSWETIDGKKVPTFIGRLMQDYYSVDGKPLGEKNPKWLQDDYVKFIRFGQWRIERTGYGILAFITNHGYLDNPTFRGMRQQLMQTFTEINVLDLHGNSKKKEKAPDGSKDENVFDIQQGVAVGFFAKPTGASGPVTVDQSDLWGLRENKYQSLSESEFQSVGWGKIEPHAPAYLFVPQSTDLLAEYEKGWKVTDIFPVNSVGVVTARDHLTIHWSPDEVWDTVQDFASLSTEEARRKYSLGKDARDWKVEFAQGDLRSSGPRRSMIHPILYRPFDTRFTYYTGASRGFICMPRPEVMRPMLLGTNLGLLATRQTRDSWAVFAAHSIVGHKSLSAYDITSLFPLYGHPPDEEIVGLPFNEGTRDVNVSAGFIAALQGRLGVKYVSSAHGDLAETIGAQDILDFIYAIMYCPTFRRRYAEFLKADFPRVPLPSDRKLYSTLAEKGAELVSLHLLKSTIVNCFLTKYDQAGNHLVEKARFVEANPTAGIPSSRVYINAKQYFEGVPKSVWEFQVGGYQICEKWLKDRKGRHLSSDDIDHYQRIIVALSETIRIMREIDELIPAWPLP
jgi:predicted helicase